MKATFPMLVAGVMTTGLSAEKTGHLVASAAAVLAVPAATGATWRLLRLEAGGAHRRCPGRPYPTG